jgi:cytochrome bd-type quinol oxidase subunit 1
MSAVDWSRLQFATTSIYHFLFVPLTIGLAFLTAILQTLWYRKGDPEHLRLTRFFGTLLVINVAVGVVTGLVQEFQFGMNWSSYSRFVGDVFGAPLAMEGLAAFFLESVFLGLWLFGWERLSRRVHLATIWAVAVGGVLSAAFIMAANSWMQRPVGYQLNQAGDRAQLTDIWAVLTNEVFLWAYLHVLAASLVTAGVVMLAVSAWHLRRRTSVPMFERSAKLAIVALIPATMLALFFGGHLGINETRYQPMKIAAAEANGASFLALKTTGEVRDRARRAGRRIAPLTAAAVAGFALWTQTTAGAWSLPLVVAVLAALAAAWQVGRGRDGVAFAATSLTMAAVVVSVFVALYPRVMVSSLGEANDLTITNTASAPYALRVMTVAAAVLFPVVLAYQAWTYYVFRSRVR